MAKNESLRAANAAAIFADVAKTVSDIDIQIHKQRKLYKVASDSFDKVKTGKHIIDLSCSKLGYMTLIVDDAEFLCFDLVQMISTFNELMEFIDELEELPNSIKGNKDKKEAHSIILASRMRLYDTKVFFYRFVGLSSLGNISPNTF